MPRPYHLFLALICLTYSCGRQQSTPPAIRDFSDSLRPALVRALGTGIIGSDPATWYIRDHATDEELKLLSRSEHPILRTIALREMTTRPSFDHLKVMLQNLDDSAIVLDDHGEWGLQLRTVTDVMIEKGKWKTIADRQRLIDEILLHHDNLRSAYTGLSHIDTPEKYYPHLKAMVVRDRPYDEIEDALYSLAKYRKKEDLSLIKQMLMEHANRWTSTSFGLMEYFPDSSYIELLTDYFKRRLYRFICRERSVDAAVNFVQTVAVYKNDPSARMLEAMLTRKPFVPCSADTGTLKDALMNAVWQNPCPAYAALRKKVKWYFDKKRADKIDIDYVFDSSLVIRKDTSSEQVRWW